MHIAMHAVGKITLFFCAGAIYVAAHKTEISDMDGIGRRMPVHDDRLPDRLAEHHRPAAASAAPGASGSWRSARSTPAIDSWSAVLMI